MGPAIGLLPAHILLPLVSLLAVGSSGALGFDQVVLPAPPASPCPQVFFYEPSTAGWRGIVRLLSPPRFSSMQLGMSLAATEHLPEGLPLGNLSLRGGKAEARAIARAAQEGRRSTLELAADFPCGLDTPKLINVTVNGRLFCAAREVYPDTKSTIMLYMSLDTGLPSVTGNDLDFDVAPSDAKSRPQVYEWTEPTPPPCTVKVDVPSPNMNLPSASAPSISQPQPQPSYTVQDRPGTIQSFWPPDSTYNQHSEEHHRVTLWSPFEDVSFETIPPPSPPPPRQKPPQMPTQPPPQMQTPPPPPVRLRPKPAAQPQPLNPVEECGVPFEAPNQLVTHGASAARGRWPWLVALFRKVAGGTRLGLNFACGGSLVSTKHVLTAAHCVSNSGRPGRPLPPSSLVLYLGKHDLASYTERGQQTGEVESFKMHPEYANNSTNPLNCDVAVLTLVDEVVFSRYVRPVCLWSGPQDLNAVVGKIGQVPGWGTDDTGYLSNELRVASMPIVSQETCLRSHESWYNKFTSDRTFCAGFRNGTGACNGDSGGGLYLQSADGRWLIRGVVSASMVNGTTSMCDTYNFIVFTDVAKFLPWVKDQMAGSEYQYR